ncbi:MAG: hypothetical protein AB7I04_06825 [Pseudomonadales bacterium]
MNTKPTFRYGPTIGEMRLSRLSHPRATLFAIILLAVVFLLFGLFTSSVDVSHTPAPNTVDGAVSLIGHWVVASLGMS